MNVPFVRFEEEHIKPKIKEKISEIIDSGRYISGKNVAEFEERFAAYCGTKYCVAVSSGTAALIAAINSLEHRWGVNDVFILTPDVTFIATTNAIMSVGYVPLLCDIDLNTYNIDMVRLESIIEEHIKNFAVPPKCIIPVHLHGRLCDMEGIQTIADKYGMSIIEDACQAHGARDINAKRAGSFGDAGCFSFYPAKNLGCYGEGGAVVTNDPTVFDFVRMYRDHGSPEKYKHVILGTNARMSEIQAAVLNIKLGDLSINNDKRTQAAILYSKYLHDLAENGDILIPNRTKTGLNHVFHVYAILSKERDKLEKHLNDNGIGTLKHYPRAIHEHEAYINMDNIYSFSDLSPEFGFKNAETFSAQTLSLPMFPSITVAEIKYVCDKIKEFYV